MDCFKRSGQHPPLTQGNAIKEGRPRYSPPRLCAWARRVSTGWAVARVGPPGLAKAQGWDFEAR